MTRIQAQQIRTIVEQYRENLNCKNKYYYEIPSIATTQIFTVPNTVIK